ncbi:hypothetical protein DdX_00402 [Ditylenchus destructor]|uniref:Uncharacterized protein n=1 Tax=Ditylenchus destructor TaxID=166010 RepID=A0AAD4RAB8_9BILA|nr:hypothetical protein DdX_00402 [Ditylenchus destructor]
MNCMVKCYLRENTFIVRIRVGNRRVPNNSVMIFNNISRTFPMGQSISEAIVLNGHIKNTIVSEMAQNKLCGKRTANKYVNFMAEQLNNYENSYVAVFTSSSMSLLLVVSQALIGLISTDYLMVEANRAAEPNSFRAMDTLDDDYGAVLCAWALKLCRPTP